jgi:hypothetical protein
VTARVREIRAAVRVRFIGVILLLACRAIRRLGNVPVWPGGLG